jgi:hypothetical protein
VVEAHAKLCRLPGFLPSDSRIEVGLIDSIDDLPGELDPYNRIGRTRNLIEPSAPTASYGLL